MTLDKLKAIILVAFGTVLGALGYHIVQDTVVVTPPPVVVDSTPTVPPPVVVASVSTVPWIVGDSFTQYANTAALQKNIAATPTRRGAGTSASLYNDGYNGDLASIDNAVKYHGHQTMKYTQPGGTASTPQMWVSLPSTYTHVCLFAAVRFSPGFTTSGTLTTSANAYKLLDWAWTGYDGSGRIEITNTNQYDFYYNIQGGPTGALVGGGNHSPAGTISTEWNDGGWYLYLIDVDHSTKTGIAKLYTAKDGQPLALRATVSGTMKNGTAMPLLNRVAIGGNFNQTRTQAQAQAVWIGQWSVIDCAKYPNPFGVK